VIFSPRVYRITEIVPYVLHFLRIAINELPIRSCRIAASNKVDHPAARASEGYSAAVHLSGVHTSMRAERLGVFDPRGQPGQLALGVRVLTVKVTAMIRIVGASVRAFLVRGLAVVVLVLTYALGNVGTQVLSVAGISALGLTTTATPANAHRWRRYRRYRYYRRYRRRRRWW
jgi:hypothetical protein